MGAEEGKAEWKAAHPNDPLAQNGGGLKAAAAPAPAPASKPKKDADERVRTAAAASAAATAQLVDAAAENRLELNPPKPEVDFARPKTERSSGLFMLVPTALLLVGMMVMAFMSRTSPAQLSGGGGSSGIVNIVESCPAGQVPRSLVHSSLLPSEDDAVADMSEEPD